MMLGQIRTLGASVCERPDGLGGECAPLLVRALHSLGFSTESLSSAKKEGTAAAVPSFLAEASKSKPNTPSWDSETSLCLLPRFLAARPSGLLEYKMQNPNRLGSDLRVLVEARGVEPLSENTLI